MTRPLRFAAIGLDHRHVFHLVGESIAAGAECVGYCPETSDQRVLEGFRERFPGLPAIERDRLFDDPTIDFIVCAAIPRDRAGLAVRAMRAGKDVMVDKPGATTLAELEAIEAAARDTGRIFSICFSERFVVRACEAASRLVAEGAIGRVVQTTGLGPHRLNRAIRPPWFFDNAAFGGILVDIGSHQIDQFLHFTGSTDAEIVASAVANHALADVPDFEDYGEMLLRSDRASGFIRVDWYTPDGLPTWGDGRLVLLGTEGYIELRKYANIATDEGPGHVFLVDGKGEHHFNATGKVGYPFFGELILDCLNRTENAMTQAHAFKAAELCLIAQEKANRI